MIVTPDRIHGSIGGGNLEHEAIREARDMLQEADTALQKQVHYGLGPALNQCCGGAVILLFEVLLKNNYDWLEKRPADKPCDHRAVLITAVDREQVSRIEYLPGESLPSGYPEQLQAAIIEAIATQSPMPALLNCGGEDFFVESTEQRALPLVVFGAGHVAKAVIETLKYLPFHITWIDSRSGMFPGTIPANTRVRNSADPAGEVASCPPGALYLVMTYSHELDEEICYRVLSRADAAWIGLIGSATKRARFVHRLAGRGLDSKILDTLVCPIGLAGITGKRPATIAVSVAAQLLVEMVPGNWR